MISNIIESNPSNRDGRIASVKVLRAIEAMGMLPPPTECFVKTGMTGGPKNTELYYVGNDNKWDGEEEGNE